MEAMYLPEVERHPAGGTWGGAIRAIQEQGFPVPQILHLFAFKQDRTDALAAFTQGVMRGASPLSPGLRELIAAFTSRKNHCLF